MVTNCGVPSDICGDWVTKTQSADEQAQKVTEQKNSVKHTRVLTKMLLSSMSGGLRNRSKLDIAKSPKSCAKRNSVTCARKYNGAVQRHPKIATPCDKDRLLELLLHCRAEEQPRFARASVAGPFV
jgi:hypothetical protein